MPENGATTESTEPTEVQTQSATPADVAEQLGEGGEKALKAERAARTAAEKREKSLQAQLDEIKRSQMSDLEKAQSLAQEQQAAADAARAEALRWRIAAKHGISDEDAETFLTGADEETLTRQAERLAALNTAAPAAPRPDRTQGGSGHTVPLNGDGLEQALKDKLGIN